jgi:hypothetical protein
MGHRGTRLAGRRVEGPSTSCFTNHRVTCSFSMSADSIHVKSCCRLLVVTLFRLVRGGRTGTLGDSWRERLGAARGR